MMSGNEPNPRPQEHQSLLQAPRHARLSSTVLTFTRQGICFPHPPTPAIDAPAVGYNFTCPPPFPLLLPSRCSSSHTTCALHVGRRDFGKMSKDRDQACMSAPSPEGLPHTKRDRKKKSVLSQKYSALKDLKVPPLIYGLLGTRCCLSKTLPGFWDEGRETHKAKGPVKRGRGRTGEGLRGGHQRRPFQGQAAGRNVRTTLPHSLAIT